MAYAAPLTSVAEIRSRLRWDNVTECAPTPGLRSFAVWPGGKFLPHIEFLFDDNVTVLQQLGFGPWHGHYTEWSDERRNVRRAIMTARTLVTGARCLLVERSATGKYLGSSMSRRGQVPLTLNKEFGRLERLVFDAAPAEVAIDLSRYHRGKHGYTEHAWRQKLKQVYAGTAIDTSMFD